MTLHPCPRCDCDIRDDVPPRPEWCGECDEFTRLRDYEGTPFRCPNCHPLAEEAS